MQTRQSKRLRDSSEFDDDIPLSSMFSKHDEPIPQPLATELEARDSSQLSKMVKSRSTSKKKEKGKVKVSFQSRQRLCSSMPVTPSSNLSDNFCRGLNFESKFKTSIMSKIIVYEKDHGFIFLPKFSFKR